MIYDFQYEMPACPWEVYICASLKNRLAPQFLSYIMEIRDVSVSESNRCVSRISLKFIMLEILIVRVLKDANVKCYGKSYINIILFRPIFSTMPAQ